MSRLEQLMKLRAIDETDADVPYMIAQEHAKLGAYSEACEWYDTCIKLDAGYHYAYFHKARAQQEAGDIAGAKATLEVGIEHARADANQKAVNEISGYIAELAGA